MKVELHIDNIIIPIPPEQDLVIRHEQGKVWVSFKGSWYKLLDDLKGFIKKMNTP